MANPMKNMLTGLKKETSADTIILIRIGDYYEAFEDDAIKISKLLTLPLLNGKTGIPYHYMEQYIHKMISAGLRIAICDNGKIIERITPCAYYNAQNENAA